MIFGFPKMIIRKSSWQQITPSGRFCGDNNPLVGISSVTFTILRISHVAIHLWTRVHLGRMFVGTLKIASGRCSFPSTIVACWLGKNQRRINLCKDCSNISSNIQFVSLKMWSRVVLYYRACHLLDTCGGSSDLCNNTY